MHPVNLRPPEEPRKHQGQSTGNTLLWLLAPRETADECFAADSQQQRAPETVESRQTRQEFKIVPRCLAETDAGIDTDTAPINTRLAANRNARFEIVIDIEHDLLVARRLLHRLRIAQHVHYYHRKAAFSSNLQGVRIGGEGGDIVDNGGPGRDSLGHDRSPARVD